ncbi:MAG: pyridoxal 5'-phosphate synthase glutaminase subunit PdxT [Propionibacteriaceae bacterium]
MIVGVLAVQGDVREHARALEACGVEVRTVRRVAELDGLAGLVIPGGESTTIGKLCDIAGLTGPIRERIAAGFPVYGSCAGMIMLAGELANRHKGQTTFGGIDMVVRRNAFGRQVDSFEEDIDVTGVAGGPVRAVFIRAPYVESVGANVEVLARSGADGAPIVAVRQDMLLATSFHPEVTEDIRIHQLFVEMCSAYLAAA